MLKLLQRSRLILRSKEEEEREEGRRPIDNFRFGSLGESEEMGGGMELTNRTVGMPQYFYAITCGNVFVAVLSYIFL